MTGDRQKNIKARCKRHALQTENSPHPELIAGKFAIDVRVRAQIEARRCVHTIGF
jgi:hypothetical protein